MSELDDLTARTSTQLANMLLQIARMDPEHCGYDLSGQFVERTRESILQEALAAANITVTHRGWGIDYAVRGQILLELGDPKKYPAAISDVNIALEQSTPAQQVYNLSLRAAIKHNLGLALQGDEAVDMLTDSLNDRITSMQRGLNPPEQHGLLAKTQAALAEHKTGKERRDLLTNAAVHYEILLGKNPSAVEYGQLGYVLAELADTELDADKRRGIKQRAVTAYEQAYKLEPSPELEERIEELKKI